MSAVFLVSIAMLAAPVETTSGAGVLPNPPVALTLSEPRRLHDINQDVGLALRHEALARSPSQRSESVHQLADLYREILQDPRYETSPTLCQLRIKVWSRLTRVKQRLLRQLKRDSGPIDTRGPDTTVLDAAQLAEAHQTAAVLASHMSTVSRALGGPAAIVAHSGLARGGGAVRDDGQQLVELIERTISPQVWEANGGPASIVYYAQLHALVVRATAEVHQDAADLLLNLRRAGP